MENDYDLLVIGGGIMGCSLAWGAARTGARVAVVDGNDRDFRASVGNFGLIWTQGKGANEPAYADWTRRAARCWPEFARCLEATTGIDIGFQQKGGLSFVFSKQEADKRMTMLGTSPDEFRIEMILADDLRATLPDVGPEVYGATFSKGDGAVNPLLLLRALQVALRACNVTIIPRQKVEAIAIKSDGFALNLDGQTLGARRVILAAGLGNLTLAESLDIKLALFAQRGQLLITSRTAPFLHLPNTSVRQNRDGTVFLGSTQENVGLDKSIEVGALAGIAARAIRAFPRIADLDVIRSWSCLRIMTPDGLPIYQESDSYPGAFVATAHSGITLAGIHALELGPQLVNSGLPAALAPFSAGRFDDWHAHAGGESH